MALWEGTPHPPDPATLPEQGKAAPGAGARRGWFGGRKPSAGSAGAPDPGRELGTISADAGADPNSANPAADSLCPLGVAPLPSLVTVQGVLAAFKALAEKLADKDPVIVEELLAVQGKPADIGGYYLPDPEKAAEVMRPSKTFNDILANL